MTYVWMVLALWIGFWAGYLHGFRRGHRRGAQECMAVHVKWYPVLLRAELERRGSNG